MPSPSSAITRFDLSLTYNEFSLRANRMKFIALMVLPALAVGKQASDFAKVTIANLLGKVEDTEREPYGDYSRSKGQWTTDSYTCSDHGVEEVVDDEMIARYRSEIRSERIATMRAIDRVLQALEAAVASAVFNTSTWTGSSLTTAVGTAWTTKATADPIANIDAAVDKVEANCGVEPNALILSKKAFRAMIRTERLEALLKYDASDVLAAMNSGQNQVLVDRVMGGLHDLLQLDKIIVGRGKKNTADEGQTPVFGNHWDETMAMVAHVNDDGLDGDLESSTPCIGRTLFWDEEGDVPLPGDNSGEGSLIVEEYREERRRGGVIRARNHRGIKILHPQAGHLLTNVTA